MNGSDYGGMLTVTVNSSGMQGGPGVSTLQPTASITSIQPAAAFGKVQSVIGIVKVQPAKVVRGNASMLPASVIVAIDMSKVRMLTGARTAAPLMPTVNNEKSWVDGIMPPGGYSFGGAALAIVGGCGVTGGAYLGIGLGAAMFTEGISISALTLAGCIKGAEGGALLYMVYGDNNWPDTSPAADSQDLFYKLSKP